MYNDFNNDDWNVQSQNNYNFNDNSPYGDQPSQTYYKEIIVKPEKSRKRKFMTYVSLVVITSIVTSFTVGGVLYGKFSKQLDEQVGAMKQTVALASDNANKAVTEVGAASKTSGSANL